LASPLTHARLSKLKAKRARGRARHLVEAPAEVTLVGESSCERDVNEREVARRCESSLRQMMEHRYTARDEPRTTLRFAQRIAVWLF
jgi:hypothetical protein